MTVSDQRAIAALLREVADIHHSVYRITDGDDPDWASWYADWLLKLSEFPTALGKTPVRSHLIYELVRLDREYTAESHTVDWPAYYAQGLSDAFAEVAVGQGKATAPA